MFYHRVIDSVSLSSFVILTKRRTSQVEKLKMLLSLPLAPSPSQPSPPPVTPFFPSSPRKTSVFTSFKKKCVADGRTKGKTLLWRCEDASGKKAKHTHTHTHIHIYKQSFCPTYPILPVLDLFVARAKSLALLLRAFLLRMCANLRATRNSERQQCTCVATIIAKALVGLKLSGGGGGDQQRGNQIQVDPSHDCHETRSDNGSSESRVEKTFLFQDSGVILHD